MNSATGDRSDREVLQISPSLRIPLSEVVVRFDTSGGAGGQHANRSSTRAEVAFDVVASPSLSEGQRARIIEELGPLVVAGATDSRSQTRNRELALQRLTDKLAAALRVDPPRRATRPTLGSKRRRLEGKRRASERKDLRRRPSRDD